MLQQPAPEDFVLATGETHPVREFVEKSFTEVGIELKFVYSNLNMILLLNHALGGKGRERRNTRSTLRRGRASSKSTPDTSVPQKSSMSFFVRHVRKQLTFPFFQALAWQPSESRARSRMEAESGL